LNWTAIITGLIAAAPGLLAAYHAIQASRKGTVIKANVNGNMERLLTVLEQAAVTVPHDVAAKVVAAPPVDIPDDATSDERLALEFLQKIKPQ